MITPTLLEITVEAGSFLKAAAVLAAGVAGQLTFVFLFRRQRFLQRQKKAAIRHLLSDLIAETVVAETPQEVEATLAAFRTANDKLLQTPFARRVLIRELVKTKDDISGSSAENLRFLFEALELDKDCYRQFLSKQWHKKAKAIQQLAEMQQSRYLVKIYRETNHANSFVRTEAQLAVVKLTGFKGLRFLNIVRHPVSQWQQLSLLNQLKEGSGTESDIRNWLSSSNPTVVEFALRLTELYKCYGLHSEVVTCLQHPSAVVRLQALHALREVYNDSTTAALLHHFTRAGQQEQHAIVDMLGEIGTADEICFLTALLGSSDESLRYRASQALHQLDPTQSDQLTNTGPACLPLLSPLTKKAV